MRKMIGRSRGGAGRGYTAHYGVGQDIEPLFSPSHSSLPITTLSVAAVGAYDVAFWYHRVSCPRCRIALCYPPYCWLHPYRCRGGLLQLGSRHEVCSYPPGQAPNCSPPSLLVYLSRVSCVRLGIPGKRCFLSRRTHHLCVPR